LHEEPNGVGFAPISSSKEIEARFLNLFSLCNLFSSQNFYFKRQDFIFLELAINIQLLAHNLRPGSKLFS
jgi:hypothetical protein